jgi:glycosyltransferase involved in cell wall biosynthesis
MSHQSDYRLTIDTPEDFSVVSKLLAWFKEEGIQYSYSVEDIIKYLDSHQEVAYLNQSVSQRAMPINIDSGLSWEDLTASPLVTVYITNYNYSKYIRQSIDSVFNQSFRKFELIIIDDGSTDSSRSIIQEYAGNKKVRVLFQDNKGLNATNNIALNLARGKYIIRLDADDYLDENALLLLYEKMENNPGLAMIFPDYYMINEDGKKISHEYRHDFKNTVSLYDQPAHGACTMIRKEILLEVGGYSEEFECQDGYELWVKIIGRHKIGNINLPLFYYRQHGNSLTSNNDKILKTRCDIIRKHTGDKISEKHQNLCIIPIRADENESPLALRAFSETTLLDITIDQALHAKNIDKVILTTNDDRIYGYAKQTLDLKIIVNKRPTSLAAPNVPIEKTVNYLLREYYGELDLPEMITILNYEYPLRSSKYIDQSIDVICLYDADSSLSVSERSRNLYRHAGNGLVPFSSNTQLRLERDAVYEERGGIHSFRYKSFCESRQLMSGKVTHILLDEISCKMVQSEVDFEIAQYLYQKHLKANSTV